MSFSKIKAVKYGIEKLRKEPVLVFGVSLIALLYLTIPFYIVQYVLRVNEVLGTILLFAFLILMLLILLGYMKIGIDIHDGNRYSLKDLLIHYKKLPDFLIGLLFYLVLVAVSSLFLVIPGIFIAVKFSFGLFFILQGDGPALEALKKSWKITKGQFFNLLLLYLFLIIVNVLGFGFAIIGAAFTMPVSIVAIVYSYRKLAEDYQKKEIEEML